MPKTMPTIYLMTYEIRDAFNSMTPPIPVGQYDTICGLPFEVLPTIEYCRERADRLRDEGERPSIIEKAPMPPILFGGSDHVIEGGGRMVDKAAILKSLEAVRKRMIADARRSKMRLTRQEFLDSIIAQDDDNDYQESGWVACVFPDGTAAIGRYGHCSCYGTFDAMCGGGISDYLSDGDVAFDWIGPVEALIELAERKADPTLTDRESSSDDYDYDHLMAVYAQVLDWAKSQVRG